MPIFTYKALSHMGKEIAGESAATSAEHLRAELETRGMVVSSVTRRKHLRLFTRRARVKAEEFLMFNQEFVALLRAGIAIPEILELIATRPEQPVLQRILGKVLNDVRQGASLSSACSAHPEIFDNLYISSIKIGEKSGTLAPILQRYQAFLQLKISLTKKLNHALAYPIFLLLTMLVVLAILFVFVLPRFIDMYAGFDAELPLPTQYLMAFIEHVYIILPALIVLAVASFSLYRYWTSSESGQYQRDSILLHLPWIGAVLRLHSAAQVARTLSTLLAGSMPLVDTIHTTAAGLKNRVYARRASSAARNISDGVSLSHALGEMGLFPGTSIKMLQAGEASGNLESMLSEIALYHEELLEYRLTKMMNLVEPAIMLLMGILVGGIIFIMYLPVFSVAEIIQ